MRHYVRSAMHTHTLSTFARTRTSLYYSFSLYERACTRSLLAVGQDSRACMRNAPTLTVAARSACLIDWCTLIRSEQPNHSSQRHVHASGARRVQCRVACVVFVHTSLLCTPLCVSACTRKHQHAPNSLINGDGWLDSARVYTARCAVYTVFSLSLDCLICCLDSDVCRREPPADSDSEQHCVASCENHHSTRQTAELKPARTRDTVRNPGARSMKCYSKLQNTVSLNALIILARAAFIFVSDTCLLLRLLGFSVVYTLLLSSQQPPFVR